MFLGGLWGWTEETWGGGDTEARRQGGKEAGRREAGIHRRGAEGAEGCEQTKGGEQSKSDGFRRRLPDAKSGATKAKATAVLRASWSDASQDDDGGEGRRGTREQTKGGEQSKSDGFRRRLPGRKVRRYEGKGYGGPSGNPGRMPLRMTTAERGGRGRRVRGIRRNGLGKPGPYGFKGKGYGGPSGILVGCLSG